MQAAHTPRSSSTSATTSACLACASGIVCVLPSSQTIVTIVTGASGDADSAPARRGRPRVTAVVSARQRGLGDRAPDPASARGAGVDVGADADADTGYETRLRNTTRDTDTGHGHETHTRTRARPHMRRRPWARTHDATAMPEQRKGGRGPPPTGGANNPGRAGAFAPWVAGCCALAAVALLDSPLTGPVVTAATPAWLDPAAAASVALAAPARTHTAHSMARGQRENTTPGVSDAQLGAGSVRGGAACRATHRVARSTAHTPPLLPPLHTHA